jgi:hypothetical protein
LAADDTRSGVRRKRRAIMPRTFRTADEAAAEHARAAFG